MLLYTTSTMNSAMFLPSVPESAKFISSQARSVKIQTQGIKKAAKMLQHALTKEEWLQKVDPFEPPGLTEEDVLEWMFLLDTLNFCFWSDEETKFTVSHGGKKWTGYRAMCAALSKAVQTGMPLYRPSFYATITQEDLERVFHSETHVQIPLLERRVKNLHEAAAVLKEKFGGRVSELIHQSNKSAVKLSHLLAENFTSYHDVSSYNGRPVSLLKRAQIFAADVWSRFNGEGFGEFDDIDKLTMFPDYRVPQCLLYLDVLKYSPELMGKLQRGEHLDPGCKEEVEIRGCTVWAVELMKEELQELEEDFSHSKTITSAVIDYYLWNYAKLHSNKMAHLPIHKTLTVFY